MIDWTLGQNRKRFQEALQKAYTDYDRLEMFMDNEMDQSLAEITQEAALDKVVFKVVQWGRKEERIDELFQRFCDENPRLKDALIADLQNQPFIGRTVQLSEQDWTTLFLEFASDDSAYLQIAVRQAFRAAYHQGLPEMRPDGPPINTLNEIQDLLKSYDNPVLAVRFVECAIEELGRSVETHARNLTGLKTWRDRIAQQFNVLAPEPKPNSTVAAHAYLLVTLEEVGAEVNVYPELHLTGREFPIDFGASPTTCLFDEVAARLSNWIQRAEETIAAEDVEEAQVTLEVFLPCRYLEEAIETTWRIQDQRGREIEFGVHRQFVVRSFDRIRERTTQRSLKTNWSRLQTCVEAQNACRKFHTQTLCPGKPGILKAILQEKQATGLKFVVALPQDASERKDLLYDIIDAAVPIALWSSDGMNADSTAIEAEFNQFLAESQITNFASLAGQWRMRRVTSSRSSPLRLLCDRPDRLPKLLNPEKEDDLFVPA